MATLADVSITFTWKYCCWREASNKHRIIWTPLEIGCRYCCLLPSFKLSNHSNDAQVNTGGCSCRWNTDPSRAAIKILGMPSPCYAPRCGYYNVRKTARSVYLERFFCLNRAYRGFVSFEYKNGICKLLDIAPAKRHV